MTFVHSLNRYLKLRQDLQQDPRPWLETGVAGFIGSNQFFVELLHNLVEQGVELDAVPQ